MNSKHPWRARLFVAAAMLILAFIGIVATDLIQTGGWEYWKWSIPVFALMALWLSWYERRSKTTVSPITLWHEFLHWLGLFAVILLIEIYVEMGLMNRVGGSRIDSRPRTPPYVRNRIRRFMITMT